MLAALTAMWAAVFSSHALAFRAGSPLLALLPPIALVAFADTVLEEFVKPVYGVAVPRRRPARDLRGRAAARAGVGAVVGGTGEGGAAERDTGRGARGVAFAAVALALIAPLLVPGSAPAPSWTSAPTTAIGVHIDPLVSVANNLQREGPVDLFTVETPVAELLPLGPCSPSSTERNGSRVREPTRWRCRPTRPKPSPSSTRPDLSSTDAQSVQQQFHYVSTLDQAEVPVGATPVALELSRPAMWDAESGTVTVGGSLDEGTDYTATSLQIAPTPEELRAASPSTSLPTPAQLPQYYQLPDNLDPKIQSIADDIVEKAGSPDDAYDKAIAIQNFLTSGSFVYDSTVAKRDDSTALLDFLTTNPRGMCQQFATAMAAMLRMEGVPSRVAVGFTSGVSSATDTNLWTVSTNDAHAWPEVLIPDYGWLPFEPTPQKTNPVANEYLSPSKGDATCDKPGGCPRGGGGRRRQEPA